MLGELKAARASLKPPPKTKNKSKKTKRAAAAPATGAPPTKKQRVDDDYDRKRKKKHDTYDAPIDDVEKGVRPIYKEVIDKETEKPKIDPKTGKPVLERINTGERMPRQQGLMRFFIPVQ